VTVRAKYNAAQGLVEDGVDGLVVEPEDREIAKAVKKIIEENSDYSKISEAPFRKAKKYDWNEVVGKIENSYEDFA
jgi:glycosyltransferase involved in cell wall biosynthesis